MGASVEDSVVKNRERTSNEFAVESDINHVSGCIFWYESDQTSRGALHLDVVWNLALVDRNLQLAFSGFVGVDEKLNWLSDGAAGDWVDKDALRGVRRYVKWAAIDWTTSQRQIDAVCS